jgi:hypothetical protein
VIHAQTLNKVLSYEPSNALNYVLSNVLSNVFSNVFINVPSNMAGNTTRDQYLLVSWFYTGHLGLHRITDHRKIDPR